MRGGSWNYYFLSCTISYRYNYKMYYKKDSFHQIQMSKSIAGAMITFMGGSKPKEEFDSNSNIPLYTGIGFRIVRTI